MVNTSLLSGTFPNSLKTAVVKPLLKKRNLDNTMLSNYRPISNLPFIGKIKSAYYHLKNIARIRCFVSSQDLEKLVHAFITSRVDYCNGLLTGLPKKTIRQLQLIQNAAARILTRTRKSEHQSSGPYTFVEWQMSTVLRPNWLHYFMYNPILFNCFKFHFKSISISF